MPATQDLIFLSYAREDEKKALRLFKDLRNAGLNVWFDKEAIPPGTNWKLTIQDAIKQSRYFIAILSSSSVSKKGFVQNELRQAINILDSLPQNETYLIPVRLDSCIAPHDRMNDFQWVDFFPRWQQGKSKLLRFFGVTDAATNSKIKNELAENAMIDIFAPTMRTDGLYQSTKNKSGTVDYYKYLRFYENGTVIGVSSTGEPHNVINWFNNESNHISKGKFNISGKKLIFFTESEQGVIDYECDILGNTLIAKTYSHINEHRGVSEYNFIRVQ